MKYKEDIEIRYNLGSFKITQYQFGTGFIDISLYEHLLGSTFLSLKKSVPFVESRDTVDRLLKFVEYLIQNRQSFFI